jgi:type IV pilus assembly protein PilW
MKFFKHSRHLSYRSRGLTIVELMVAVAIGIALTTIASAVYLSSTQSYRSLDETGRVDEAGRLALKIVSSNLQTAGFRQLDGPRPQLALPPVPLDVPLRGCRFGFVDPSSAGNDWTCKPAGVPGDSDSFWVLFDADAYAAGSGKGVDCLGNQVVSGVVRQAWNHFFIQTDTISVGGQNRTVSQLMCAGRNPNNPAANTSPQPLLSGVRQLTLTYGVAPVGQETPTQFVSADALLTDADWASVVAVRVCVLMQSETPNTAIEAVNPVDCRGNTVQNTDRSNFKTLNTTIALRNRIFGSP